MSSNRPIKSILGARSSVCVRFGLTAGEDAGCNRCQETRYRGDQGCLTIGGGGQGEDGAVEVGAGTNDGVGAEVV